MCHSNSYLLMQHWPPGKESGIAKILYISHQLRKFGFNADILFDIWYYISEDYNIFPFNWLIILINHLVFVTNSPLYFVDVSLPFPSLLAIEHIYICISDLFGK